MTNAPYFDPLASALERLAWEVGKGQIAGIAIVGIRKDGSAVSHMRLPDDRDAATGMMGGLALAAVMTARKAGLSQQQARDALLSVIAGIIGDARSMEGY